MLLRGVALDVSARCRSELELRQLRLRELRGRFDGLTSRECEVLRHVVQGERNKQIAGALGIGERTVKLHRTAIMTKLDARSVAELVR